MKEPPPTPFLGEVAKKVFQALKQQKDRLEKK